MTSPLDMGETSKPPVRHNYERIVEGENRGYQKVEQLTGAYRKPAVRPVQSIEADSNLNAKVAGGSFGGLDDLDGSLRCFFDL